jgi:hypothetical protein
VKVRFVSDIQSFIKDFQAFRQNRAKFNIWLAARRINTQTTGIVEGANLVRAHGQEFAVHAGQAWLTCDCDDEKCTLGEFVDQQDMMDVLTSTTKFIHKDCQRLTGFVQARGYIILGDLGSFKVIATH